MYKKDGSRLKELPDEQLINVRTPIEQPDTTSSRYYC
jgi:hypothetical protein